MLWQSSQQIGSANLIIAHGKLYFFRGTSQPQGPTGPVVESNLIEVVDASNGHLLHTIAVKTSDPEPLSLVMSGDILYAAMNNGSRAPLLQAYNLSDESLLWQKTYKGRILTLSATGENVYIVQQFLHVANPTKKDPANYTTQTIALQSSGSERWRWTDPDGFGTIAAVEVNGVVCVVDGNVAGVRASDGVALWRTILNPPTGFPPAFE
ncbi:MAG TPA: hypothetical protein VGD98_04170 [Ktedonobacteraceae bacterium]